MVTGLDIRGGEGMADEGLRDLEWSRCGKEADEMCSGRADDKMASEYNLEGGATLHLVLALRGGF